MNESNPPLPARKPDWLRIQLSSGAAYATVQKILRQGRLNTVCAAARCPNLHECWDRLKTATFLLLGDTCTRHCRFCAVASGRPEAPDLDEPRRVAEAALNLGLRHVVLTMVTRDDLSDGGATIMAETVGQLRHLVPTAGVEVLASDFGGNPAALAVLAASRPDILGHNLETVRRLTPLIRSRSSYEGSLDFLRRCRQLTDPAVKLKSSLMLGLGESRDEVRQAMVDLRSVGVDMLNLGQYLQPGREQLPVVKYWTPEEFAELKIQAQQVGFGQVESGPLVRSSYHAAESAAAASSPT